MVNLSMNRARGGLERASADVVTSREPSSTDGPGSAEHAIPPRHRIVLTGVLAFVSFAIALSLVEITLRVMYSSPPGLHFSVRAPTYRPDSEFAYSLRPGAQLAWGTREFTELDSINAEGFRDDPLDAETSMPRILAVGDSFTFGHGGQMDESYPKVLQQMLRDSGRSVRVVNAGVPGYGMDQSFRFVIRRGIAMHPNLVLVGVQCSDLFDAYDVPLYDTRNGRLVELDATKTYPYLQGHVADLAPHIIARTYVFGLLLGAIGGRDPYGQRPRLEMPVADWAREKIRYQLIELADRAAVEHIALVAVLLPCAERLEPGTHDPYGSLAANLDRASVPVLDTLSQMQNLVPNAQALFFPVDRHLTPEGNRVLATVVANFIETSGL